ncbi:hypothetical protein TREES_T100021012 [Tupaia chinensis]|uniref:Uncharacterized protein n=1 Tax=Tupaia chinensis TaxID=246437 RepID=L9JCC1_TUPCH|nr:hypothetical protein TREES_T100021012 [Tupaia chinensis]
MPLPPDPSLLSSHTDPLTMPGPNLDSVACNLSVRADFRVLKEEGWQELVPDGSRVFYRQEDRVSNLSSQISAARVCGLRRSRERRGVDSKSPEVTDRMTRYGAGGRSRAVWRLCDLQGDLALTHDDTLTWAFCCQEPRFQVMNSGSFKEITDHPTKNPQRFLLTVTEGKIDDQLFRASKGP